MANGVGGPHQLGRGQNLAQGWHSLYELAAPLSQALNSIPFGGLSFLNHKGGTLPTSEGETRMCDAFKRLAQGACPGNVTHHTVNVLVMVGGEAERRHGRKQCRQAGATCREKVPLHMEMNLFQDWGDDVITDSGREGGGGQAWTLP